MGRGDKPGGGGTNSDDGEDQGSYGDARPCDDIEKVERDDTDLRAWKSLLSASTLTVGAVLR